MPAKTKPPLFSIVTTTYNRVASGYLLENIRSIQLQEVGNYTYEHIIVDDGSSDETSELMAKEQKNDESLHYIRQENQGPAKAVQTGVTAAKGEYTIILDDDDKLPQSGLRLRAEYLQDNPDTDWFYGQAEWVDGAGLPIPARFTSKYFQSYQYERLLIENYVHAGTVTVRTSAIQAVEWPSWLERSQDYFLWLELSRPERKLKLGYLDSTLCIYRAHDSSYTSLLNTDAKLRKKYALNARIRNLHGGTTAFLANEAFIARKQAHLATYYRYTTQSANHQYFAGEGNNGSRLVGLALLASRRARQVKELMGLSPNEMQKQIRFKLAARKQKNQPWSTPVIDSSPTPSSKKPSVSVVVPFYNQHQTAPQTLSSIFAQTWNDVEVILVNDGSEDPAALDYLQRLDHPRLTIINQDNQGVAAARNAGIDATKSEYIVCLDADDMIAPTYLEALLITAAAHPVAGIITCDKDNFGELTGIERYSSNDMNLINRNSIITAAMFKRQLWEEVGGYKSDIGYEDWEFWVNLVKHGARVAYHPDALFKYRNSHGSRYKQEFARHQEIVEDIKVLHPDFQEKVAERYSKPLTASKRAPLSDRLEGGNWLAAKNSKPTVLVAMSYMTFGGAETLIANFADALRHDYNFVFVSIHDSMNEWEAKFKEISADVFHAAHFRAHGVSTKELLGYLISTRNVDLIHMVHTDQIFPHIESLHSDHLKLKFAFTVFNTAAHYAKSLDFAPQLTAISTDNNSVADSYKQDAGIAVDVIPNAIDAQELYNPSLYIHDNLKSALGIKPHQKVMTFVGRLSKEKRPDAFLDAAAQLLDTNQDLVCLVVGDGPLRGSVEAAAKHDRLLYVGFQPDTAKYLNITDYLVLPSDVEGFPLIAVEAMAMECVVVASNVGAIPQILDNGEAGVLIQPGSSADVVQSVQHLLDNREVAENKAKQARERVLDKYSLSGLKLAYDELYTKALQQ